MRSLLGLSVFSALLLVGCSAPLDVDDEPWVLPKENTYLQVYFGATRTDTDSLNPSQFGDAEILIDSLPEVGFRGQFALSGDSLTAGIEVGLGVGFWSGDIDLVAFRSGGGNSVAVIHLDSFLFTTEISSGLFISQRLWDRARIYAAAGPLFTLGILDTEDEEFQDSSATIEGNEVTLSAGAYVRAGFEFYLTESISIGLQGRVAKSKLDFDPVDVDLKGPQVSLVLSAAF